MGRYEEVIRLSATSGVIEDASDETLGFIGQAAQDDYVRFVTQKVLAPEPIVHDPAVPTDWWEKRHEHIMENYPLTPNQANLAVVIAEAIIREEE